MPNTTPMTPSITTPEPRLTLGSESVRTSDLAANSGWPVSSACFAEASGAMNWPVTSNCFSAE